MAIEIKQHLKLQQQLVMTPQLQQAIKLLQLSRMELADTIRDEILENPILEDAVDTAIGEKGDVRRERHLVEGVATFTQRRQGSGKSA